MRQITGETMQKALKRKHSQLRPSPPQNPSTASVEDPFPHHHRPTAKECHAVRESLLSLHGFPVEFVKYRSKRPDLPPLVMESEPSDGEMGEESVLDGLISVVLSQNTTDVNSRRAFANLKSGFLNWEDVLAADSKDVENAIRCGGLAPTKSSCIRNMLSRLLEKRGKLCMEYMRDMSIEEIKAELFQFKGIGPKTVACVLMFHLLQDDFPVDTHIYQIAKRVGWVPEEADTKKTYLHLNRRIPNELKFDLNCLLFTHGKLCSLCSKKGNDQKKVKSVEKTCPILIACNILKAECNN